jgi:hypothetical protein
MKSRMHRRHLILAAGLILLGGCFSTAAQAAGSQFFGRWTVSDDKPEFSAKGKPWKTFDVAPCGADFCGVAVEDSGACGATLFRFLTIHANNEELTGHGRWGAAKKKLVIDYTSADSGTGGNLYLGLGDNDMDFGSREGSMPTFDANYKQAGDAVCTTN